MDIAKKSKSLESSRALGRMIKKFYADALEWKEQGKPIVWSTAVAPLEIFYALGVQPVFPESYSAACASKQVGAELCQLAEDAAWSQDICSYCRINIGHIMSKKGPFGGLPMPDFMVVGMSVCLQELTWWEYVAKLLNVPLFVLDMPLVMRQQTAGHRGSAIDQGGIPKYAMDYAIKGMKKLITFVEDNTGNKMDWDIFREVMKNSARASELWQEIDVLRRSRPSPVSSSDMFGFIFGLVDMAGREEPIELLTQVRDEIKGRVDRGEGAVAVEKFRLLWHNLPVWYDLPLYYFFESYGAAFVVETYSYHGWGRRVDPDHPLESLALRAIGHHYNVSFEEKWDLYTSLARDAEVDGAVFFVNRGCKLYTMDHLEGARVLEEKLGIHSLMIDGDHGDIRTYNRAQVENKVLAFLESLEAQKKQRTPILIPSK